MALMTPNMVAPMNPKDFFATPQNIVHKQYEALRAFFTGQYSAQEAAKRFGYTTNSFYSLIRDFRKTLSEDDPALFFFTSRKVGRKPMKRGGIINELVVNLRKKYLSVPDIKAVLDVQGYRVSERYVYNVIQKDGFERLPRRSLSIRERLGDLPGIVASLMRVGYLHIEVDGRQTLEYIEKALELNKEVSKKEHMIAACQFKALVEQGKGNWDEAERLLAHGISLARKHDFPG